jgi:hypothetical protein
VHAAILDKLPAPVQEMNPRVPASLARIIERALEKDQNRRFQSAAELRSALAHLADVAPARHRWKRRTPAAALIAVLIAGAVYV